MAGCKGIGSNLIELGGKLPVAIVKVCAHVKGEAVWKVQRSACEKGSTSHVGLILLQIVESHLRLLCVVHRGVAVGDKS